MAPTKHGAEYTGYAAADVETVRGVLERHAGPERAATELALAREARMPERRFRAIVADLDGVEWLIGKVNRTKDTPGGLFLARTGAEARSLTAEIAAKLGTLGVRERRRAAYAAALSAPAVQVAMFGATEVAA